MPRWTGAKQLSQPPQFFNLLNARETSAAKTAKKGDRAVSVLATSSSSSNIMDVPTVARVGDSNVVRKRPFTYTSAPLAIAPKTKLDYPGFNPLTIFSESRDDQVQPLSNDLIYGADIESEVTIREMDFPLDDAGFEQDATFSALEVEDIVRKTAPSLIDGDISVSAIPFFDASRFSLDARSAALNTYPGITITAQNVSEVQPANPDAPLARSFHETVVSIRRDQPLRPVIEGLSADPNANDRIVQALESQIGGHIIKGGYKMRVALETNTDSEAVGIHRVSLYNRGNHITSVARKDNGSYIYGPEPAPIPAVSGRDDGNAYSVVSRKQLPSIYNGIYRAALSQSLTKPLTRQLVKIFAFDVDFQTRIAPSDTLEVFYSLDPDTRTVSENSEILYASISHNGNKRKYYRFRTDDDGVVDYYDEFGKSAKKFLLRNPVPHGKFRSKFGMRRHPITRYYKMHTGVDWSAPRGTKILAAGNGIVEKAGWHSGGYGKQTIIRHANGYKTSYSHQSRIAKSVKPGARVRQGQVIGAVGSTGLSHRATSSLRGHRQRQQGQPDEHPSAQGPGSERRVPRRFRARTGTYRRPDLQGRG